jgi:hypothetical protein
LLKLCVGSVCDAERYGEIVDNVKQKEQIFLLRQPTTPRHEQDEDDCAPVTQLQALRVSAMGDLERDPSPGWWFHHFEPVWKPFIQWFCSQKNVTLFEFERAASQVPGLTHIEKTIAVSAFRQQQEQGLVPFRNSTAFRREHSLSAV